MVDYSSHDWRKNTDDAVVVDDRGDKVFPDPNVMIPLMGMDQRQELRYNIREFLNNVIVEAIEEQENK